MDAVKLLAVYVVFLICPFVIAHLWWWVTFWSSLAACLAITELVSKIKTGHTISQQFWEWRKNHPKSKWVMVGCLLVFWTYLILHLMLEI